MSIRVNDIPKILDMADKCRGELVPCFMGSAGIGKTQSVYQWAEDNGRKVVEEILSQVLPTEISGINMPDPETQSMKVFDSAKLSSLEDGDILFLDELLEAPPMVLSACLTLIQERRMMSGKKLPDILIVASTNPLSSPTLAKLSLRQRFMFFDVEFDYEYWKDHIKDRFDIDVKDNLQSVIELEGQEWNVITPRTMTKLIELAIALGYPDADDSIDRFNTYVKGFTDDDVVITNRFYEIFHKTDDTKIKKLMLDSIYNAVKDGVIDCSTGKKLEFDINNNSINNIINILRSDNFDEDTKLIIDEMFSNISLDDIKLDRVLDIEADATKKETICED